MALAVFVVDTSETNLTIYEKRCRTGLARDHGGNHDQTSELLRSKEQRYLKPRRCRDLAREKPRSEAARTCESARVSDERLRALPAYAPAGRPQAGRNGGPAAPPERLA